MYGNAGEAFAERQHAPRVHRSVLLRWHRACRCTGHRELQQPPAIQRAFRVGRIEWYCDPRRAPCRGPPTSLVVPLYTLTCPDVDSAPGGATRPERSMVSMAAASPLRAEQERPVQWSSWTTALAANNSAKLTVATAHWQARRVARPVALARLAVQWLVPQELSGVSRRAHQA